MWWQILLMVLSVLFVVASIYRTIVKIYKNAIEYERKYNDENL